MFYRIRETLEVCAEDELRTAGSQYVAVLTPDEWQRRRESFDMGIDLELDIRDIHNTKAEVNYDSLTGKSVCRISGSSDTRKAQTKVTRRL